MKNPLISYSVTLIVLIGFWFVASMLLSSNLLPGPVETLMRFAEESAGATFWMHTRVSAFRVVCGLAFAFVAAVPLGLVIGSSEKADRIFRPLIYLSYPVPKIVFLPIVLLLFGLGDTGKIVLIAFIVFFQLLITTRDSARGIGPEVIYAFRSLGGNRLHFFRHVLWPVCLPGVFTSLRIATGIAVAVLFFVESIGTRKGLGFFIIDSWGRADYTAMFVGIIGLSGIGVFLYELFDLLERRACKWKNV